jgi:hypothetical protein
VDYHGKLFLDKQYTLKMKNMKVKQFFSGSGRGEGKRRGKGG